MRRAFVIHGASCRDEDDFKRQVDRVQQRLGSDWSLEPVWWGSAGVDLKLVLKGIPYVLPPEPGFFREPTDEEIVGPTIAEAEVGTVEGALVPPGWSQVVWHGRRFTMTNFAGIAADALMYWHRQEQIQKIVLERIGEQSADAPVNVIAHSFGAVITVDLLLSGKLSVDGLVTFGTPPAALHVLDPTRNKLVGAFDPPNRIRVGSVEKWTNLWSQWDAIAFIAGRVFEPASGRVDDVDARFPGETPIGLAHSAYWDSEDLKAAIQRTIQ